MNNMRDLLYDADNGNIDTLGFSKHSKPGYGGGEIWFDDVLIRKNGHFILQELFRLNEENLKG